MYSFVCKFCGKKCTTHVKQRKFCSVSCATNFRAAHKYPFRLEECLRHIGECKTQLALKVKYPEDFRFCKYHNLIEFNRLPRGEKSKQKYSDEEIINAAKKYTTKVAFLKNDKALYFSALYRGMLPTFTWLRSSAHLFEAINVVYRYFFADYNAVYVGRTINPDKRNCDHHRNRGRHSSTVLKFALKHNVPIPQMEILRTGLTGIESQVEEDNYVKQYHLEGMTVLNLGATGLGVGSMGATKTHSLKGFLAKAHLCSSYMEFRKKYPTCYDAGHRHGWLGHLSFLSKKARSKKLFTKEFCIAIARRYTSRGALCKGDHTVYKKMVANKWLEECDWMKSAHEGRRTLTRDLCIRIAKEYLTFCILAKEDPVVARKLKRTGWINECTWFPQRGKDLSAGQFLDKENTEMSDNFYSYMNAVNIPKAEKAVEDEKPVEKKPLECGLCSSGEDKKSGECKFDKSVKDALTEFLGAEEEEEDPDGEVEKEAAVVSEDKAKK